MDQEGKEKTILHLTLEIMYLLTGEDYTVVKKTSGECVAPSRSGGWSRARGPITEPPPPSLIPERNNEQKIIELTHKMMELLTGEEWEYVEGHKDLYQDIVMMEDHRPLTSPDGSWKRNPPERCPAPLDSQDCPGGDDNVLLEDQGENLIEAEVIDKEETDVRSDRPCKEEDIPTDVIPDGRSKDLEQILFSSIDFKGDENNIPQDYARENLCICSGCGKWFQPESDGSTYTYEIQFQCSECRKCSNQKSDQPPQHQKIYTEKKAFLCLDCGCNFTNKSGLERHKKIHTAEKLFSCSECGKSFARKSNLKEHMKIHTGEKPFSCSECGKSFIKKSNLIQHQKIHTGEKPFSCLECGKHFTLKSDLIRHHKFHTGEKPFSCSDCGKCFTMKSDLIKHHKIHTREKPFLCTECGKYFMRKSHLVSHQRIHTGEEQFSCPECEKSFTQKSDLVKHYRSHTWKQPYSCLDCGKHFTKKANLVEHQTIHTGENPFSCSECWKCFRKKSSLVKHQKIHTGVRPFLCLVCGKSFIHKSVLVNHQRIHQGVEGVP